MIRINLLPVKAAQKQEKLKGQLAVAALSVAVTLGLCAIVYLQLLSWVDEAKTNVETKKIEVTKLMKTIGEANEFKKRQDSLQAKLTVLDQLEKSRSGPVTLLDELYKAMPDKLWLEAFKENGQKATLSGLGINEETVALFMRNLEVSPEFAAVSLKGTQQVVKDGVKLNKFDIECDLERKRVDVAVKADPQKGKKGKAAPKGS
jgi:type IV pilus assembly protein PilN